METVMKKIAVFVILLLFVSLAFADAVITEWKAEPAQGKIILQWKTSKEENVQKFIVERSADNRHFSEIGSVNARGAGFQYQFVDDNLGRFNSVFYYRLKIINSNGNMQYTDSLPVIPNVSSISRSWGSIKALFR